MAFPNQPLLSIILPVHNGEEYLEFLLKQLLENEYSNMEILIGDDDSTDTTSQIISKFTGDPRVRVTYSNKNIGAGAIRNLLLNLAKGELVAIQDADDSFDPQRFVMQEAALRSENIDVVGSSANLVGKDGKVWRVLSPPQKPTWCDWFLQRSVVHASIMFRRDALGAARYHENLKYGEDYYFLTQLYLGGARFQNLLFPLYFYRIEERRLASRSFQKTLEIFQAKWEIAKLFPFFPRLLFFLIHVAWGGISYLKQRLNSLR